jgi:SAM-dependent methyltransferase
MDAVAEQIGYVHAEPLPIVVLHLGCDDKHKPEQLGLQPIAADGTRVDRPIQMINLDMNPHVHPDILCTLGKEPIPLPDDSVDFVLALHVLEHIGDHQGDMKAWFQFWSELYRVMKPNAAIQFECPYYSSVWAWADPTHVRAISEFTFLYLNHDAYRQGGAIPDYRPPFDFIAPNGLEKIPDHTNANVRQMEPVSFIKGRLHARKPLKPYWEDAQ